MTKSISPAELALAGALSLSACIVRGGEPHPLYPNAETGQRPAAEVARLTGPIAKVDGEDVSRLGKSFTLLPGCHIVRLTDKVGDINSQTASGFVGEMSGVVFAFRMKAGYTYDIDIQLNDVNGPTGRMSIGAWERALDGSSKIALGPATSGNEIDACRQWQP
jgi:hypothetical protein